MDLYLLCVNTILGEIKPMDDFRCDKCGFPIEEEYGLCDTCWEKCVSLSRYLK